jgi:hypothetical protein
MDGASLERALTDEYLAENPVRLDRAKIDLEGGDFDYTDDDRGQIEARLKEMGYM